MSSSPQAVVKNLMVMTAGAVEGLAQFQHAVERPLLVSGLRNPKNFRRSPGRVESHWTKQQGAEEIAEEVALASPLGLPERWIVLLTRRAGCGLSGHVSDHHCPRSRGRDGGPPGAPSFLTPVAAFRAASRSLSVASPSANRSSVSTALRTGSSSSRRQTRRQQAQANSRNFRSLAAGVPARKPSMVFGLSQVCHSASVIDWTSPALMPSPSTVPHATRTVKPRAAGTGRVASSPLPESGTPSKRRTETLPIRP